MNNCCKNTDKEIWRQTHEDYYSPSIHVTEQGAIGIKCGGHVIVATVQDWHNWGKEALLDAVDHAVPAEPPKPTGEPAAFKRPCFTCGHQGNIMDKYCGSCGIEHLNWIPKPPEGHGKDYPAEQPATRVDMKDVFQGRASQCSEMATWLDLNGFKALSCALRNVAAKLVEAKQPKPPVQMICNHAGECKVAGCMGKKPHGKSRECEEKACGGFPDAVCVPWVEPVKRDSCKGCKDHYVFPVPVSCRKCSMGFSNWTPKQPEPAEQVKSCSTCGWKPNTFCLCRQFCDGFSQWKSKEPVEPGLVSYLNPVHQPMLILGPAMGPTGTMR